MTKTVTIGACQTPEFIGEIDSAINFIHQMAQSPEAAKADLLLFPEAFLQGYIITPEHLSHYSYDLQSPEFQQVLDKLATIKPTLVFGTNEKKAEKYFNSAVVVEQGRLKGVYRKTHLMPGESLYEPGTEYPVFELGGLKYGINICYDAQFPAPAQAVAGQGARVILHPAQNMMRRENAEKWKYEHNKIRQQRVRETGAWMISSDVTGTRGDLRIGYGPTCAINPQGEVVAQVPLMQAGLVAVEIPV